MFFAFWKRFARLLLPLSVAALLGACASVSDRVRLIAQGDRYVADNECQLLDAEDELQFAGAPLDGNGFVLTSWNIYKQKNPGWAEDLALIVEETDLLLLQEARLNDGLRDWLETQSLQWNHNPAFHQAEGYAGVMTVARMSAEKACAQHTLEPWLRLPKTSIVSYYPVAGHSEPILVANIHGVNFTFDEVQLTRQLQQLAEYIRDHNGPIVVAGDFNTWSQARQDAVQAFAGEVGLLQVLFDDQQPAQRFGRSLDHIYIRGLKDLNREVRVVESSDHYPLIVTLALEDGIDD